MPNLRHLSIGDKRSNKYVHPDKRKSINDVDVHCIEKCTNLESLSIVNQSNMTDIDLSGLTKLSDLCINNNMNLVTIGGIDKLSNLSYLTCYGNGALEEFNGLDQAIIQNKDNLNELKLDVLLFPKAIGYKPASGKYKQEATETLEFLANSYVPVKWCESLTNTKTTEINHPQMLTMHNKACRILNETCPRCYGVRDTVLAVERYLAENVTYDYEGKKGRHRVIDIELGGKKEKLAVGPKNGTNGAYNCLMENTCVCEGYTRGEQYLLGLRGIKTRAVSCIAGKDTMGMSDHTKNDTGNSQYHFPKDWNHSIICITDYYCLYSDPCWNAGCYQSGDKTLPYSLLTKSEMSKDHTLSFEERNVDNNTLSLERKYVEESIRYNTLFRNSKANEVSAQRATVQQNVLGLVRGKDGKTY